MKIGLVSPYDFDWPGGVTAHIHHLSRQFLRMGHTVKIIAPSSQSNGSPRDPDIFIPIGKPIPIPSGGSIARISLSLNLRPKIDELLKRERFDIVHLHEPLVPLLPLTLLHLSPGPNIGTFHAFHGSNRLYRMTHTLLQRSFDKLDGRIAVSKTALKFIGRFFPNDYIVIPNGVEVDHFHKESDLLPEFADGRLNILFLGRLEKRKGLKYLLAAYSDLKWEFPNIRLIVVGPGKLDKECQRLLSERNPEDIAFVGTVPYDQLPRYYQTAHIFCTPATGKESFGIVLLEAMASGKPIVASNIEGYRGVIENGKQGLLVPPKNELALRDALKTLILDKNLREEMATAGRETAEQYRWENIASAVLNYYTSILNKQHEPTRQIIN